MPIIRELIVALCLSKVFAYAQSFRYVHCLFSNVDRMFAFMFPKMSTEVHNYTYNSSSISLMHIASLIHHCLWILTRSHDKANLEIACISTDHDLPLFVQCIQYSLQLLWAAQIQPFAVEVLAGHPRVQVFHLQPIMTVSCRAEMQQCMPYCLQCACSTEDSHIDMHKSTACSCNCQCSVDAASFAKLQSIVKRLYEST